MFYFLRWCLNGCAAQPAQASPSSLSSVMRPQSNLGQDLSDSKAQALLPELLGLKIKKCVCWGAWVAQLVKRLTSAQVVISWFVGSSPVSGSVLTAQSLEPASDSVSLSASLLAHILSLSLKNKEIFKKKKKSWKPVSSQNTILGL